MIPLRDDNPAERPPVVTVAIIILCVAAFLWQLSLGDAGMGAVVFAFGLIPGVLTGHARLAPALQLLPPPATLVTSMFLHGSWMHLAGNMLYLWIFGNNIEDRLGHGRFILFYLLSGLAAAALQILPDPASTVPMIGASGAISGVLGAYLVLFPHARVLVFIPFSFFPFLYISALWLLGFWLLMQVLSALLASGAEGGVAWWAHIGGFLAGMLFAWPLRRRPVPPQERGPWG
jgi:membrane associated rhomboid family serine protease